MLVDLLGGGKLLQGLADEGQGLAQLGLGDDQRRGEPDDVAMCRFGLLKECQSPLDSLSSYLFRRSRV